MNELEQQQQFRTHYNREPRALALQGRIIVIPGAGAMGSFISAFMAHSGADVLSIDNDRLEQSNFLRHYVRDPRLAGQHKATTLGAKLQGEVPELQRIRGLVADLEALTWEEYRAILRGASLVIGCTGRDHIDRVLDTVAREFGIPFIAPSLWAGEQPVLGDLVINAWNLPSRPGACFSCLRPPQPTAPPAAEAQPGFEAEIQRVASLTAEVALALLLPESPQNAALMRQLGRGANYMIIPRWPPSPRAVITRRRRGCQVCSTGAAPTTATPSSDSATIRDWSIGVALASSVLWHQLVPGLDVVATIGLVAAAGLWWRGRLPSLEQTAAWLRRNHRL